MIKICAISDLHGALPKIKECDVVFICGDTFPLNIQRYSKDCQKWFLNEFMEWVKGLKCKTVYIIPGNHDFWFERRTYDEITSMIEEVPNLHGKLIYLVDSLIEIEGGYSLYACPWCIGPDGWAFVDTTGKVYEDIPDCDILLTHQPPRVKQLGCSYPGKVYEENWGSEQLKEQILKKKIKYNFCGHIHTGTHGEVKLEGCDTIFYNVSLKDEDYKLVYSPTYLEIE